MVSGFWAVLNYKLLNICGQVKCKQKIPVIDKSDSVGLAPPGTNWSLAEVGFSCIVKEDSWIILQLLMASHTTVTPINCWAPTNSICSEKLDKMALLLTLHNGQYSLGSSLTQACSTGYWWYNSLSIFDVKLKRRESNGSSTASISAWKEQSFPVPTLAAQHIVTVLSLKSNQQPSENSSVCPKALCLTGFAYSTLRCYIDRKCLDHTSQNLTVLCRSSLGVTSLLWILFHVDHHPGMPRVHCR